MSVPSKSSTTTLTNLTVNGRAVSYANHAAAIFYADDLDIITALRQETPTQVCRKALDWFAHTYGVYDLGARKRLGGARGQRLATTNTTIFDETTLRWLNVQSNHTGSVTLAIRAYLEAHLRSYPGVKINRKAKYYMTPEEIRTKVASTLVYTAMVDESGEADGPPTVVFDAGTLCTEIAALRAQVSGLQAMLDRVLAAVASAPDLTVNPSLVQST